MVIKSVLIKWVEGEYCHESIDAKQIDDIKSSKINVTQGFLLGTTKEFYILGHTIHEGKAIGYIKIPKHSLIEPMQEYASSEDYAKIKTENAELKKEVKKLKIALDEKNTKPKGDN